MYGNKLKIDDEKFDVNLKFYFFLKHLVKTKLTEKQATTLLESLLRCKSYDEHKNALDLFWESIKGQDKKNDFDLLVSDIQSELDIEVFLFSLRLIFIKDLLLEEAKLIGITNAEHLAELDPLSLEYDNISLKSPYSIRVNGALLSLLFFERLESGQTNFVSSHTEEFMKKLSRDACSLRNKGIEPNQIFMLMFSESINQSITSGSGTNYEDRIYQVLLSIGIDKDSITKEHDKGDQSTEYDFFFNLDGKTYGIGAKRTLRERYKQFIKTSLTTDIDFTIEITLGLDLNENKAKTIISHGTILFVSDEVYKMRPFLQTMDHVYSVKELNLKTLQSL